MMNTVELGPIVAMMLNWLLTYWLHSTVLLVSTWLIVKRIQTLDPSAVETLWRVALFGGIISATLYSGFGIEPFAGRIDFHSPEAAAFDASAREFSETSGAASPASIYSGLVNPIDVAPPKTIWWPWLLMALWATAATVGSIRFARSIFQLRRVLEKRQPMPVGRSFRRLSDRLGIVAPVRISIVDGAQVPFATGIFRPEVCLPRQVATSLKPAELEAVVAHELAHVARRDPAWKMLYRCLGAVLPQPFNRIAQERLERVAELLADDLAAASSGRRRELASSLVAVAEQGSRSLGPLPVAAALNGPSSVGYRIERLLYPCKEAKASTKVVAGIASGLLAGVMILVPTVSLTTDAQAKVSDNGNQQTWSVAADAVPYSGDDPVAPAKPNESAKPDAAIWSIREGQVQAPGGSAQSEELQLQLKEMQMQVQLLREQLAAERQQQAAQVQQLRLQIERERADRERLRMLEVEGADSEQVERLRAEVRARAREREINLEEVRARAESRRQLVEEERLRLREQAQIEAEVHREATRALVEQKRERARRLEAEVEAAIEAENRKQQKIESGDPDADSR